MTRRATTGLTASPTLVGTLTVLVALIGIFVTYNANQGLPFVPTYDISVKVPDAGGVTVGRDVRIAGKRVGLVKRVQAEPARKNGIGEPVARLDVKLESRLRPIRSDTGVTVRPISPLGAKYVELLPGRRGKPLAQGDSLPASRARPTVELTDSFNLFDERTRRSIQVISAELGGGFAGRGSAFNELLDEAPPLLRRLERVAGELSAPRTRLGRFVRGAGSTASELGSARRELGSLVAGGETTLGALANARAELADSLTELPPTESAGTRALRAARPALADAEAFLRDANPGLRVLRPASEQLHSALVTGIPVLRRASGLADRLGAALRAVERLSRERTTRETLVKLRRAVRSLRPTLRFLAPAQTRCNYLALAVRNFASSLSEGDPSGTGLRTLVLLDRPEEAPQRAAPVEGLHANPYAYTGQNGECEAGNEPWVPGTQIGHTPGNQGGTEPTGSIRRTGR